MITRFIGIIDKNMTKPKPNAAEGVHSVVLNLLKNEERGRVLDAAAGEGHMTYNLLKMGFIVTPCDINPENFKVEGIKCDKVNLNEKLPYPTNSFDYVVSIETIEHIENPWQLVREFSRVLKPGGKLILTTPNVSNIPSRALYLIKCDFHRFGNNKDHITPLPLPLLKRMLEESGFEIEGLFTNKKIKIRRNVFVYLFYPFLHYKNQLFC